MKLFPGPYLEGFQVIKAIGEGRYGRCYLISNEKDFFVLKQLKKKVVQKNSLKMSYEEEVLKALRHEAIPQFVRKIENKHFSGYILEYKPGATFEQMIFEKKHRYETNEVYNIGKQLMDIIKYLHVNGVVHRDIRIPNTLFYENKLYLVDFGLARWIDDKKYKADIDFSYLGDFLLHLYYTSFHERPGNGKPWYEELMLSGRELKLLKKLMGVEPRYKSIFEVEADFEEAFSGLFNKNKPPVIK